MSASEKKNRLKLLNFKEKKIALKLVEFFRKTYDSHFLNKINLIWDNWINR